MKLVYFIEIGFKEFANIKFVYFKNVLERKKLWNIISPYCLMK